MMMSFLAHIEGGVATSEAETQSLKGARERAAKVRAGAKIRWLAPVSADLEGEGSTQRREESGLELKSERHHTSASLFNVLHDYLIDDAQLLALEEEGQLADLHSGQLVEVFGEYVGNPLESLLKTFTSVIPYIREASDASTFEIASPPVPPKAKGVSRQVSTQTPTPEEVANLAALRMIERMASDLDQAPVHDLLFQTFSGLRVVVTVSSEFYSASTSEYLRAGDFRVIGKVTRVLKDQQTINLTRRTVIGAGGADLAQTLLGVTTETGMTFDQSDPIVSAPAVQMLPLAIYI